MSYCIPSILHVHICISCNIAKYYKIPRNSIQSVQYEILAIQQAFKANWRSVPSSYERHFSTGSMVLVLACLLIFPLFATGGKKEDDLHLEIDYLLKFPVRGWLVSRWYHWFGFSPLKWKDLLIYDSHPHLKYCSLKSYKCFPKEDFANLKSGIHILMSSLNISKLCLSQSCSVGFQKRFRRCLQIRRLG